MSLLSTLSVVMPTFNRSESLRVSLDGLARQSLPTDRWEAVIVSDGSTDGTDALLAEYAAKANFRLRPILQANAGPSRARNHGMREAEGDVVVFLDDDVEPVPNFLAAHAAHHERNDHIAVIGPLKRDPARRDAEPPWIGWEHAMLEKQYTAFETGEWAEAGPHHFYSGNASVRREHLLAIGGFDEKFTRQEDVEMATRLARDRGVTFVFDPEALGTHRPTRTWESWLKIPYAYGQLDVVRARRGDASWDLVRHGYIARSRPTRLLTRLVLQAPVLGRSLRLLLRTLSQTTYRARRDGASFAGLSAVYNVRYMEGVRDELQDNVALQRLLFKNVAPARATKGDLTS